MFSCRRAGLLPKFPRGAVGSFTPAIQMADRRDAGGHIAIHLAVHCAFRDGSGAAWVDAILGGESGFDSFVFWLRRHPLPVDGRRYYFQAGLGVHGSHGGSRGGLFRTWGFAGADFPRADDWASWRHDRYRNRGVSVSTLPRMDAVQAG